jgi:hypothetical protein
MPVVDYAQRSPANYPSRRRRDAREEIASDGDAAGADTDARAGDKTLLIELERKSAALPNGVSADGRQELIPGDYRRETMNRRLAFAAAIILLAPSAPAGAQSRELSGLAAYAPCGHRSSPTFRRALHQIGPAARRLVGTWGPTRKKIQ